MLVLGRREGESIMIGDDIVVKVTQICGGQVKIGVSAPPHIAVDREEIRASKDSEVVSGNR